MNILYRLIYGLLYLFFPSIKLATISLNDYDVHELERNSECYCGSGVKYKDCHLKINTKNNQIALKLIDKTGKHFIQEVDLEVFQDFKGIKKEKEITPSNKHTPDGAWVEG